MCRILIFLVFALGLCLSALAKDIRVYAGPGTTSNTVRQALTGIRDVALTHTVSTIEASELLNGDWEKETALLVIPGGADLPYTRVLDGLGTARIRRFVESGGAYLGICAGSYFAGSRVEFGLDDPHSAIVGDRELAFFPGVVRGPALARYSPYDFSGARAANIDTQSGSLALFYLGGGEFVDASNFDNVTVLGRYQELGDKPAAIVECLVGLGKAILTSVHLETDPSLLPSTDPHITAILPELERDNTQRTRLLAFFLHRLGL